MKDSVTTYLFGMNGFHDNNSFGHRRAIDPCVGIIIVQDLFGMQRCERTYKLFEYLPDLASSD